MTKTFLLGRTILAASLPCLLLLAACYTTVPIGNEAPNPEVEHLIELTAVGAQRLSGVLGPTVVAVRGQPVEWGTDSVTIAMRATVTVREEEQYWQGERVAIPRDAISRVSERRLDRGKTALTVVGGLALAVLAREAISGRSSGVPRPPVVPPGQ